jgi:hypothetical protein
MPPETNIAPVKPGIAYATADGDVIDLTDGEAQYVLDQDERIRHTWIKFTGMSGQLKKPVEERHGRIVLLDGARIERLLRNTSTDT